MSDQYRTSVQKSSFEGKYDISSMMVTTCGALAIFSCLEMVFLILTTFTKWKGLYFWSLTLCNIGILMYGFGFMMLYFEQGNIVLCKVFNDLGWIGMVVCQSLVLYSRLGLIVSSHEVLTAVKWMIIVNSVILVPFPIIFDFGTTFTDLAVFPRGFFYIEHVQITIFSLQECIISTIYVIKTMSLLKVIKKSSTKGVMHQLLVINLIIIPMDVLLIVMQFKKLQLFQEGIKVFVYSVKLKLEIHILSKLVDFIRENKERRAMGLDAIDAHPSSGNGTDSLRPETLSGKALDSFDTNSERQPTDNKSTKGKEVDYSLQRHTSTVTSPGIGDGKFVARPSVDAATSQNLTLQYSRNSQRLKGRESDAMYADVLRTL